MKRRIYLLERISDAKGPYGWRKGERIWADAPSAGWRIIAIQWTE